MKTIRIVKRTSGHTKGIQAGKAIKRKEWTLKDASLDLNDLASHLGNKSAYAKDYRAGMRLGIRI